jgi:hypothetical protein
VTTRSQTNTLRRSLNFSFLVLKKCSPRPVLAWRITVVTLVLVAVTFSKAAAQGCSQDCVDIVESVLRAFAEYHSIPLSRVVVDSMESGRTFPSSAKAVSPRPLSARDIVRSSRRLGSHAVSKSEFGTCFLAGPATLPVPPYCSGTSVSGGVVLFAPEVRGDSSTIRLRYYVNRPEATFVGSGIMRFELTRGDRQWQVTDVSIEARGHRPR